MQAKSPERIPRFATVETGGMGRGAHLWDAMTAGITLAERRVHGTASLLTRERYWAVDRLPLGEPTIGVPSGKGRAATRSCNP